jgi:hypothetical protein
VALFRKQYRQVGGIEIEVCVGRLAANVPTYAGNETFRKKLWVALPPRAQSCGSGVPVFIVCRAESVPSAVVEPNAPRMSAPCSPLLVPGTLTKLSLDNPAPLPHHRAL